MYAEKKKSNQLEEAQSKKSSGKEGKWSIKTSKKQETTGNVHRIL